MLRFQDELRIFVRTQAALLAAMQAAFAGGSSIQAQVWDWVPRAGELRVGDELWSFQCHGGGFRFVSSRSGRCVDVHERVDEADVFDLWRLGTYFRSFGPNRGRTVLARAAEHPDVDIDQALSIIMDRLLQAGVVQQDGSGYSLVAPNAGARAGWATPNGE